jgi:class 3 adenylate cyclase/tetratricopeptide (TPR) repeat protein
MTCPQCGQPTPPDAKFCSACGVKLITACPACGVENAPGSKFCKECGQPFGQVAPSPPISAPSPAPQSYTPAHLAERILHARSSLEGERKQVTVLFADMKGSMELLADRDPEEARRILDPVLERMMEAVHHYEGTVNNAMGDGIMALFGAPLAHEDHAVRACYAALRMQEAIRRHTAELRRSHGLEVQIRVGLNSGEVVVGSIGGDLRMDYTAIGQTTHLAARMEQLATPGTIRLTGETLRLAEGWIRVKPLGPMPVKGLGEPVEVHELIGAAAARTRLQAASTRGLSRFVGRDTEMVQLRAAAEQAGRGQGQMVAVVGEPGVGKSRLFHEFIESHRVHDWLVLQSSSVSYGKATAYLPLIDLLKGYFKIADVDDTRAIRSKVTGTALTLDEALKGWVPPLLWLLEALPDDEAFRDLEPPQRRQRTLEAIRRIVLRESRVQPLLVVFEDLHWVDGETQAFLDGLVESLPTAAILLAVNYRPEYQHGWARKTYYRQLRIDPLPPESAEALLTTLLGEDPSIAPLRRLLIARTEGNPLFLEESIRALVETRALVGEGGDYRLARAVESIQVPPTVQAILAARIDRLPAEQKRLLQAASVVGKDVPLTLLQAIAEMDEGRLHAGLVQLQAAEFLYETSLFPDLEYTFKHALTHDVAYSGLLGDRRRQLHAAIVEAMERLRPERLAEQVEFLAHHALRGEMREKAVRYLRQAGVKAAARSANRQAVEFFEQALTLLQAFPQTLEALTETLDTRIALGPVLLVLKGNTAPEVEASYLSTLALVDRLGDGSRRFPVLWGLWYCRHARGQYDVALAAAERLLAAARAGGDTGEVLEAHHAFSTTLLARGRPMAAVVHEEAGIALYDRQRHASQAFLYGGHDAGACCRWTLALNTWLLGYPDRALVALTDAIHLAEELNHPLTMAFALWIATWVHHQRGERDATVASGERLLALVSEYGFAPLIDFPLVLLPTARGERLDGETLDRLHRHLIEVRSPYYRYLYCRCVLAELYAGADLVEEGLSVLASIGEEDRDTFCAPEVQRIEGELLLRRSTSAPHAAEICFRRALALAADRGEKSLELRAAMSLARLLAARGDGSGARAALAPIYGWFTEGFDTADLLAAKALLAELG